MPMVLCGVQVKFLPEVLNIFEAQVAGGYYQDGSDVYNREVVCPTYLKVAQAKN